MDIVVSRSSAMEMKDELMKISGTNNYVFESFALGRAPVLSFVLGVAHQLESALVLQLGKEHKRMSLCVQITGSLTFDLKPFCPTGRQHPLCTDDTHALSWEADPSFSKLKDVKVISLPVDKIHNLQLLHGKWEENAPDVFLKLMWIHDNYRKYSKFVPFEADSCHKTTVNWTRCLIFSPAVPDQQERRKYVLLWKEIAYTTGMDIADNLLLTVFNIGKFSHFKIHLQSWQEASKHCQHVGGYLPFFRRREELEEILALFKLSKHIPPLEATFVGLCHKATAGQVGLFDSSVLLVLT